MTEAQNKAEELKNELQAALECSKFENVPSRLNAIDLLLFCTRCGGGGQYSYCQSYGTRCFKCHGVGKIMPKITKKLIKLAKEKWTPEVKTAYFARLEAKKQAKKILSGLTELYTKSKIHAYWNVLAVEAGCKGWMAEAEWVEANHPEACEIRTKLLRIYDAMNKALNHFNVSHCTKWDAKARSYIPCDICEILAVAEPFIKEMKAIEDTL